MSDPIAGALPPESGGPQAGDPASLGRWMAWLYPDPQKPCRCDHVRKSLGRLHGVNMGEGWLRTTTHPDCFHHGTKAQKVYKTTGRWPR